MKEDDEANDIFVSALIAALVEEEKLPRERVERGVKRFLEAIKREGVQGQRWRDKPEKGGERSR